MMPTWTMFPLLFVLSACEPDRTVEIGGGAVVTLADYFDCGEHSVTKELAGASGAEGRLSASLAEQLGRAVVRVRIHHNFHGDAHSTTHATGTLVNGGRCVATVAHELTTAREHPDARIEIVLCDGRVLAGRMRPFDHYDPARAETDWAFFDVVDPPTDLPNLELGVPDNEERLVLGFPGRYGRDAGEHVVLDEAGKGVALRPLRILCRARSGHPAQLELTAGCVPIGGMSGAPCVDVRGHLVSIQRAVTDTFKDGRAFSTLDVVAVEGLRAALARSSDPK